MFSLEVFISLHNKGFHIETTHVRHAILLTALKHLRHSGTHFIDWRPVVEQMQMNFQGLHAIVTGGAQGIGFEITRQYLMAGAKTTVWDFSSEALQKCQAELSSFGDLLRTQKVDVTDRASCAQAADNLSGPIDILVNNAGITRDKLFIRMAPEDWDAVINTNLTGLFNVTKAVYDKFKKDSTNKRIINISSISGHYGNLGQGNYAAAKAGVIGMTKTWAKEFTRKAFTVNAIAPGFIATPMTKAMPQDILTQYIQKIPVGRMGEPAEIAKTCLFLSSTAAAYINGAVINVDGGLVL
jgi:3-oxoacyl-[acyl-carrier protein] reductase